MPILDFIPYAQVIGVMLVALQLFLIYIQAKACFEHSIRENTYKVLKSLYQSLDEFTVYAVKIVSDFSEDQCRKLYGIIPFEVKLETKEQLCLIFPVDNGKQSSSNGEQNKEEAKDNLKVQGLQIMKLRWFTIKYLNALETALTAWQQGMIDNNIIEEELAFLFYTQQESRKDLPLFRKIAGNGKSYPNIERFVQHVDNQQQQKSRDKLKGKLFKGIF